HADTAWHSGNGTVNRKSIGIEHEGFAAQGQTWYTEAMYKSSAALVRWLADTFNVTRDRAHIIGHYEVPDASHAGWYGGANHHHDPCDVWLGDPTWHNNKACYWNWDHYMALVNGTGPTGVLTGFVGDACCGIAAATRKPLVGATVTLVGTSSTAVTDSTGFYTFTLPAGTYTPRASMTNYTAADHTSLGSGYSAQIAVSASTTAYGSIVLAASAPSVTKPVVKIVKPVDGSSSATAQVTVTGTVDDKAVTSVVIGTKSYAASAGAFTGSFDLVAGLNTITVSATNAAGTGSASARVSYAPPSTGIQGTVMSTSSTPIAGVKLVFTPGSAQVITDADGKYALGLAAGTYTLAATAPGYLDKTQSVTVPADRILTQDLVLTVDPSAVPRVRIDSPANGQVFTDPVVDVSGFAFVQNLAALTVNGETVAFAGDHSFDVAVTLAEGPNTILIEATDAGGQAVHAQVTVEYAPAALSAGGCGSTGVNPGVWMLVVAGVVMARRRTATVHGLTAR
ncbi:MAG: carboxypeptidase regulatory-like domain-containing protein, partial [Deltaproteobacteria bacterium]|nr:carboxypeptidase regulatory-like domain-containing protein [Deltaproteobacteria bacterium]